MLRPREDHHRLFSAVHSAIVKNSVDLPAFIVYKAMSDVLGDGLRGRVLEVFLAVSTDLFGKILNEVLKKLEHSSLPPSFNIKGARKVQIATDV